ncbi:hypothetical protein ON010_g1729 [Phytophthora cinnamomi]|nr:hypothetical protein ON010_g1729 [Phytophthora cinnamomi]
MQQDAVVHHRHEARVGRGAVVDAADDVAVLARAYVEVAALVHGGVRDAVRVELVHLAHAHLDHARVLPQELVLREALEGKQPQRLLLDVVQQRDVADCNLVRDLEGVVAQRRELVETVLDRVREAPERVVAQQVRPLEDELAGVRALHELLHLVRAEQLQLAVPVVVPEAVLHVRQRVVAAVSVVHEGRPLERLIVVVALVSVQAAEAHAAQRRHRTRQLLLLVERSVLCREMATLDS